MSKFHGTISRRNFMKALGLAGAGLGAAAATAPVFHDLDELASSADHRPDHPWYVKQRKMFDPSVPLDWDQIKPFDSDERADWPYERPERPGPEVYEEVALSIDPDLNWTDPRRQAMQSGARTSYSRNHDYGSWLGDIDVTRPSPDRYPKWTGDEETAAKLLTGAVRFFGAQGIGVMERDEHLMKLIFKQNGRTGYEFDSSIDAPEIVDLGNRRSLRKIPSSFNWAFVWPFRQPMDATMRQIGGGGTSDRNPLRLAENFAMAISYNRINMVEDRIQKFVRGLGYDAVAGGMSGNVPGNAVAIMTGWGEHVRMGQPMVFPKWGVTPRGTYRMLTNLPLPPDNPIDFGAYEFCKTCEICSDTCPSECIQKGEPTWEGNPPGNPAQAGGYLGWHTHFQLCPHCPICHRMCPFNALETDNQSFVHDFVKGVMTNTSIFNSFFTSMEKSFGYSHKTEGDYWDVFHKHPVWGWDSTT